MGKYKIDCIIEGLVCLKLWPELYPKVAIAYLKYNLDDLVLIVSTSVLRKESLSRGAHIGSLTRTVFRDKSSFHLSGPSEYYEYSGILDLCLYLNIVLFMRLKILRGEFLYIWITFFLSILGKSFGKNFEVNN